MPETLDALPAKGRCKKRGHKIVVAITKRETTQLCFRCGRGRRFANVGPFEPIPLDNMTADEIERRILGPRP